MALSSWKLPDVAPEGYQAILGVEAFIRRCGLERSLIDLVKLRASQINGCAFCIDMHMKDARRNGETEQRLYLLNAWRETGLYTERERAALAWTEHLTRLPAQDLPVATRSDLARTFSVTEIANLTVLIGLINLWNTVAIGGGFHLAAS